MPPSETTGIQTTNLRCFAPSPLLKPLKDLNRYRGNEIHFKYIIEPFDSTNRIIDKQDNRWVTHIDGRPVWGTDGNYPRKQVAAIEIVLKGKRIDVNRVFYSDIYECTNEFTIYKNSDFYLIHQWNSDAAGSYELVWVISENGIEQRLFGGLY